LEGKFVFGGFILCCFYLIGIIAQIAGVFHYEPTTLHKNTSAIRENELHSRLIRAAGGKRRGGIFLCTIQDGLSSRIQRHP